MECAEAIGLDETYLKKIEEQNRLREEIAKRKSERRQITYTYNEQREPERRIIEKNADNQRKPVREIPRGQPRVQTREPAQNDSRHPRDRNYPRERSNIRERINLREFARDRDTYQRMTSPGIRTSSSSQQSRQTNPSSSNNKVPTTPPYDSMDMKKAKVKAY